MSSCIAIGANQVPNVTECEEAASTLGLIFGGSETAAHNPSGCYFYEIILGGTSIKAAYWNNHSIGDNRQDYGPICKSGDYFL